MGICKIVNENYPEQRDIHNLCQYILDSEKTRYGLVGGYGLNIFNEKAIIDSFLVIQKFYLKESGRRIHHFILAFNPQECMQMSLEDIYQICQYVSEYYIRQGFQVFYGVHDEGFTKGQIHVHFGVNTVNFKDGRKLENSDNESAYFMRYLRDNTTLSWRRYFGNKEF